ncbi:Hypothetical protein R9X50_00203200 [Acrodontium crateriforme]|uniref:GPN-loop GTPase n=1 Tax=Acrodontium crateriforme TaxID=150365 RepID=A0AAQ3M669_9PEZI|nr:Hypothetical protein R9X50_00203200 [Acrodontium crateriforme]
MASQAPKPPVAIICIGMAGSGKTTFMQRINAHLHQKSVADSLSAPPYVLNLDPAVRSVPFESNIDIRDSVNYKEVMKQYNLGPNGGIITSLNLFSTKIDQVMGILEKRCLPKETSEDTNQDSSSKIPSHIIVDTPGQIEVFVWSASGAILLSAIAASFPTVLAYVIDTPRTTANTSTFMSNMLYAISILYKTQLPMILVFNKTDVKPETEAVEWMRDFESFQAALHAENEAQESEGGGYMGSLLNSMSLVLEEFYNQLSVVGVSSITGDGVDAFFVAVEEKRVEFERDYAPELARRRAEAMERKEKMRESEVDRMMKDMQVSSKAKKTGKYSDEPETVSEAEDADSDSDVALDDGSTVDDGLQARYQKALQDGTGNASGAAQAAKHIQQTQR